MKSKKAWYATKKALSFFILLNLTYVSFSQTTDSLKTPGYFGGGCYNNK